MAGQTTLERQKKQTMKEDPQQTDQVETDESEDMYQMRKTVTWFTNQ